MAVMVDGDPQLLPDYLIIGASRSGTTFLHHVLGQHPSISAVRGEPHYFDWNYGRGTEWYRWHFPAESFRDQVVRGCGALVVGEKSPNYLFDPRVPERVQGLLPEAKLIVLLRDPVARAVSNFHQERRRRIEPSASFAEVVEIELRQREARRNGTWSGNERPIEYLARGRYAEQLERWFARFDARQFHVIQSEKLFASPVDVVAGAQRFLGVDPVTPTGLSPLNAGHYGAIEPALIRRVREFYEAENARLAQLLEDPPRWR
jgi:hypothetical protein